MSTLNNPSGYWYSVVTDTSLSVMLSLLIQVTSRAFPKAEVVHMGKNLKARGSPEQWLASVDKRLAEQLRRKTNDVVGILAYLSSMDLRAESLDELREIDSTPIQVASLVYSKR